MKSLACYAYRLYIFDICFSVVAVKSGLGSSKLIAVSAFRSRNCIILFQFLKADTGCWLWVQLTALVFWGFYWQIMMYFGLCSYACLRMWINTKGSCWLKYFLSYIPGHSNYAKINEWFVGPFKWVCLCGVLGETSNLLSKYQTFQWSASLYFSVQFLTKLSVILF